MSHNTKPGGPVNYTAILAPLREVNERLRARAEAAEAEVERLGQAEERLAEVGALALEEAADAYERGVRIDTIPKWLRDRAAHIRNMQ